jgi:hypothetical protein
VSSIDVPRLSQYLRTRRAVATDATPPQTVSAEAALVRQQTQLKAKAKASATSGAQPLFVRLVLAQRSHALHWKDFFAAKESVQQCDAQHAAFRQLTAAVLKLLGDVRLLLALHFTFGSDFVREKRFRATNSTLPFTPLT